MTPKSRPKAIDEGRALLDAYHGFDQATAEARYSRAIDFRENAIRLILLDFHLAFDDILKDHLAIRMRGQSAFTYQDDRDYLDRLSAATVIDLASRLGAIDRPTRDDLLALNKLRNTASHTWNLVASSKRRKAPLRWKGARLTPQAVLEELLPHYGNIYENLFKRLVEEMEALGVPLG